MKKEEFISIELSPMKQSKLFFYGKFFEFFLKLYNKNLLPNMEKETTKNFKKKKFAREI